MQSIFRLVGASLVAAAMTLPGMALAAPTPTPTTGYHIDSGPTIFAPVSAATIAALESHDYGNLKPQWNVKAAVSYADHYWNCTDPHCDSKVGAGSAQPNFECAEFVSRALVAGGVIRGLTIFSSQAAYEYYKYNGKVYDLLWVSQKQGGPIGLEDYLKAIKWHDVGTSGSRIHAGAVVFAVGSDGNWSHVAFGVGNNEVDAHNNARYHITDASGFYQVDGIYSHS